MTNAVTDIRQAIETANQEVVRKMVAAQPVLVSVQKLKDLHPEVSDRMLTHSGPPVTWEQMSGAQRGAVFAACRYEGWARDREEAEALVSSGGIRFVPNHALNGVGPMGGVISPNMHVYVVRDRISGCTSYSCTEFDAFYGAFDEEALAEVKRWNDLFFPVIGRALASIDGLELKPLMAQALSMGDELHSRQVAASALLAKKLAPGIVRTSTQNEAGRTLDELSANELTFLPISMAACKVTLMAAEEIPYSTVVTVMARNGTEFGLQVSGLGRQWFTAPSPRVKSLFFPGYKEGDEGLDVGDSAITETSGLGAFAAITAPAITDLIGAGLEDLQAYHQAMQSITVGTNPSLPLPQANMQGTSLGIDIRKVVQISITPILDTAAAHKEPGHRIIGAGIVHTPVEPFQNALTAWSAKYLH